MVGVVNKEIDGKQAILFPEVLDDYIEEDNPVKFMDASYLSEFLCYTGNPGDLKYRMYQLELT